MTDHEKLIQTFTEIGVKFEQREGEGKTRKKEKIHQTISLDEGEGYGGFYCDFYFSVDGKYIRHACYE